MKNLIPLAFLLLPSVSLAQTTWYVPDDFPTIQAGITASWGGDTVIVRDGTYVENIRFNGKAITLKSENGPATTLIDGNQNGTSVVTIMNGEGGDLVLEGFTVTNGSAGVGGGMAIGWNSSPTLRDCTFTNNTATLGGGGVWCDYSSPTFFNCSFVSNNAAIDGGGMYCHQSFPTLDNCTFTYNTASVSGGMHCRFSSPTLDNCTFFRNTSANEGGGMKCLGSSPTLNNCSFSDNIGSLGGGMHGDWTSSPTLDNCSFTGNTATMWGGGMYCEYSSSPTLDNCIFWGNFAAAGPEIYVPSGWSISVSYSDVRGGWSGTGNIDVDPLFVDPVNKDFHLRAGSPCIDTGDPNSPPDPDGTRADMGAFYYNQAPTLTITKLIAGKTALVEVSNCTPVDKVFFAWSLAGGGPLSTPYGPGYVSKPFSLIKMRTDLNGHAVLTQPVPPSVAGKDIWFHGVDIGSATLLNPLAMTIQ